MMESKISKEKHNLHNDNLLDETLEALKSRCIDESDIEFVCIDEKKYINWEDFKNLAKDCWYDSGFGLQAINNDLCIVGKDWWLERVEYDGSEGWAFKTKPLKPNWYGIYFEDLEED